MKEVEINGKTVQIRPLTRKEIRELKEYGFNFLGCLPKYESAIEAQDKLFELMLTDTEIKYLEKSPLPDSTKVWKEILNETYGSPGEEKN